MLTITIFAPLAFALAILALPRTQARWIRAAGLCGAGLTLALTLALWAGFEPGGAALQWRTRTPWIPSIGASYDVAVDGISLPLLTLTAVLLVAVMTYVLPQRKDAKGHAFLFLLMGTGLMGVFASQDLLLFYLFFEVALVPMYFVIGIWGHEGRRYAAMKFFLYTRAGSLAMLLGFLGLYFAMDPHTFSLPAIVEAQPLAGAAAAGGWVMAAMLLGFGVKLPTVPLHNWLPDAHVEAPTEGSVILAGLHLKMGGFGLLRVLLPAVPDAVARWGWLFLVLGLVSLVYGALAALGQRDLKRLIAYTSVSHMGFVAVAVGVAGLTSDGAVQALAISGATYQLVSHGLLTGGMFFLAGMLEDEAGTRDLAKLGGLKGPMRIYCLLLGALAFGSFGLPGFSGFVAELQVIGATLSLTVWAALAIILGLAITTALYLTVVVKLVLGPAPEGMPPVHEPPRRRLAVVAGLLALSLVLGIVPAVLLRAVAPASAALTSSFAERAAAAPAGPDS